MIAGTMTPTHVSSARMARTLLHFRLRAVHHRLRVLDLPALLRLIVVAGLVGFVLVTWAFGRMDGPLAHAAGAREAIRMEAYRLGAFLAAATGFLTFGTLWRNRDIEVLNLFPVPPKALFRYRLLEMSARNLPLLTVGLLAGGSLAWRGHPVLALETCCYLAVLYVTTIAWSIYWHAFAGNSVGTPSFEWLKIHLAGAMVLKDRTLLLYSPFLGAVSGFAWGLVAYIGLTAVSRGDLTTGLALLLAVVPPVLWACREAEALLEKGYYQALAALAEGEQSGELGESAPRPGFLGEWYAVRMPPAVRPFVVKDLRQAWRRNRLDYVVLLTSAGVLLILAAGRGREMLEAGWAWPATWVVLALAAGQAFGMTRPGSDAPWQWLSLPAPMSRHYAGRLLSTGFFVALVAPWLALALCWAGEPWERAFLGVLAIGLSACVTAANIAVALFGNPLSGRVLFASSLLGAYAFSGGRPILGAALLAALAVVTLALLARLPARLALLEQERRGGRPG